MEPIGIGTNDFEQRFVMDGLLALASRRVVVVGQTFAATAIAYFGQDERLAIPVGQGLELFDEGLPSLDNALDRRL